MSEQNDGQGQQEGERKEEAAPRVDEGWKKSVAEERQELRGEQGPQAEQKDQAEAGELPAAEFRIFVAGLYTQTLMALGEVENTVTHKKEASLPEAQYLIDTIDMLKQKTQGNLSSEEESYLISLLHDLRMRYVSAAGQPAEKEEGASQ